jgi:hypothetical protein
VNETTTRCEPSSEGEARIEAVDGYLEQAIGDGRPIEALIATRWLGEIVDARAKEAARAATEGSWSWSDVGRALGVSKQAAHEKLRAKIDKHISKVERAEQAGHARIARRAERARDRLDQYSHVSPKVEAARERLDEWERGRHEKLGQDVQKARDKLARAERKGQEKLNDKG